MPQSLTNILIHIVFSTKDRVPFLRNADLRAEMHRMLGGISASLECPPVMIGGTEDHVHLLGYMGRTIALSDWVKELKRQAAVWVKRDAAGMNDFSWQGGYGAFSVSQSVKGKVVRGGGYPG